MKKTFLLLTFFFLNFVYSQDSIVEPNKKIIYEFIIRDNLKDIKNDTLFVTVDFNQEVPKKASTGILGNNILSTYQINTPFKIEVNKSKIYPNISYNFKETVGKEKTNLFHRDEFYLLDIKVPIDKWLHLNFIEILGERSEMETKIFIPAVYEYLHLKNFVKIQKTYFYEFKYSYKKGLEFVKKIEF